MKIISNNHKALLRGMKLHLIMLTILFLLGVNLVNAQTSTVDSALYIDQNGNTNLGANLKLRGDLFTFGNNKNLTWLKAGNNGFTIGNNNTKYVLNLNDLGINTDNQDLNLSISGKGNMYFSTNGNTAITINQAGNIAISKTAKINKLEIDGNLHMDGNAIYLRKNTGSLSDYIQWTGMDNSQQRNEKIRISGWLGTILGSTNNNTVALKTNDLGFVGIGDDDAEFPLHVSRKQGRSNYSYVEGNLKAVGLRQSVNVFSPVGGKYSSCSIFALGDIVTKEAIISSGSTAYSDIRLKKDINASSSQQDLEKLKQIEIVNYKMIDTIADHKSYKKVIAQQVQKVYPLATNVSFRTLPNVFQTAISTKKIQDSLYVITIEKTPLLNIGDELELKSQSAEEIVVKIMAVNKNNITVKSAVALNEQPSIFVYGTKAKDVLTVDYDAIGMLNVSATQELAKIIAQQQLLIVELNKQNAALKNEQATTKNTLDQILARLAPLEDSKNKATVAIHSSSLK
ncbi:hypothetical protein FA048_16495 [Pedobacter polaris]|uniref:Peptidase S74 domain-containing protein n=1 Tax=Pedobacter polaris TaxID=2571273 RepID=A0A4V5NZG6_9SPHI|nr:tail fiber domain-containing protein [Pedobacter polaris]TKC06796.1 hypothetical protein FA048_16495 [Pedobacter polaris]